jgi:hypothetical protein
MKPLLWIGLVVLFLGLASLLVPIPRSERHGLQAGDVSIGITTQSEEKVSPMLSGLMILGGAGLMIAGKGRS